MAAPRGSRSDFELRVRAMADTGTTVDAMAIYSEQTNAASETAIGAQIRWVSAVTSLAVSMIFQRSDRNTGTDREPRPVPRRVPVVALSSSPECGASFAGEPRGRKPSGRAGTWPNVG